MHAVPTPGELSGTPDLKTREKKEQARLGELQG